MNSNFLKNIVAWLIWLMLLILWNYLYPQATPLEDVLVSIAIAMILRITQRIFLNY